MQRKSFNLLALCRNHFYQPLLLYVLMIFCTITPLCPVVAHVILNGSFHKCKRPFLVSVVSESRTSRPLQKKRRRVSRARIFELMLMPNCRAQCLSGSFHKCLRFALVSVVPESSTQESAKKHRRGQIRTKRSLSKSFYIDRIDDLLLALL